MQPTQDLAVIRAQPCPGDFSCFLINRVRHDRKCVHVQPDARTLNNHRRPPDLQMWLYQRECSPMPATHESFCSARPSASAGLHTVYNYYYCRFAKLSVISRCPELRFRPIASDWRNGSLHSGWRILERYGGARIPVPEPITLSPPNTATNVAPFAAVPGPARLYRSTMRRTSSSSRDSLDMKSLPIRLVNRNSTVGRTAEIARPSRPPRRATTRTPGICSWRVNKDSGWRPTFSALWTSGSRAISVEG